MRSLYSKMAVRPEFPCKRLIMRKNDKTQWINASADGMAPPKATNRGHLTRVAQRRSGVSTVRPSRCVTDTAKKSVRDPGCPVERGLAETSQPDRDLPFRAWQYRRSARTTSTELSGERRWKIKWPHYPVVKYRPRYNPNTACCACS
jgi:hypothetical protein